MKKIVAILVFLVTCYLSLVTVHAQTPTTVHLTKYGFSPQKIEVVQGATITFINDDREPHWPEGGDLNIQEAVKGGEKVDYTANQVGTFTINDKLDPSHKGTIVVDQTSFRTPQPQIVQEQKQEDTNGLFATIIKWLNQLKDFILGK